MSDPTPSKVMTEAEWFADLERRKAAFSAEQHDWVLAAEWWECGEVTMTCRCRCHYFAWEFGVVERAA